MTRSVEIPDEAVETGGRIIAEHQYQWPHLDEANRALLAEGWQPAARAVLVAARPYLMPTRGEIEHALYLHWWDEDSEPCACGFDFVAAGQSFKVHLADVFAALLSTSGESGE